MVTTHTHKAIIAIFLFRPFNNLFNFSIVNNNNCALVESNDNNENCKNYIEKATINSNQK